ncbi:hypothetical protein BDF19DRAFT_430043, partial [Syncephalis fuscata]
MEDECNTSRKRVRRSAAAYAEVYEPITKRTRNAIQARSSSLLQNVENRQKIIGQPLKSDGSLPRIHNRHDPQMYIDDICDDDDEMTVWPFKKLFIRQLESSVHYGAEWTAQQKEQLFRSIARHGLHNLTRLSDGVSGKSTVECAGYLANIRRAMSELRNNLRQSYQTHLPPIVLYEHPTARCSSVQQIHKEERQSELSAWQDDKSYQQAMNEYDQFYEYFNNPVDSTTSDSSSYGTSTPTGSASSTVNKTKGITRQMARTKALMAIELFHLRHALELSQNVFFRDHLEQQVSIGYDTFLTLYTDLRRWLTKLIAHIVAMECEKQYNYSEDTPPTLKVTKLD